MDLFLQLFVLGCATGGIYAISAIGVVLVFRSSGVINFSHGAVAMVGGYVTYTLADSVGLPHVIAIPVGIAASSLVGVLTYLLVMRPLANTSTLTRVIATLGVFVVLQQSVLLIYGSGLKVPSSFLPQNTLTLGPASVGADQLIVFLFSCVLTAAFWYVYRSTNFGLATTAVAESPRSLEALGWNVDKLRAANWALGGALGGVAGAALAPTLQLQPGSFALLIIPTLASAMLAGLRSFPLTLAGGVALGVLQAECSHYVPVDGAGDAVPFLVIIAVLILMGRSLPLRNHINERLPRVGNGIIKPFRLALAFVALVIAVQWILLPEITDGLTISILTATILLSQVVVTGYAGQLSLAQIPIAGVGAIVAGRAVADYHVPFLLAIVIGGLAAIPIGLAIGLPALRARGVSLAIATLGFAVAINAVILRNNDLNGGSGGTVVGTQSVFGFDLNAILYPGHYAIFAAVFLIGLSIIVANVRRGRAGRRMLAVRTNERAAASLGVNVAATKLYAFVLAGVIAGVGGVISAFRNPVLTFSSYDPLTSINGLIQAVIGGIGYPLGALLGGLGQTGGFLTALTNQVFFDAAQYLALILGLGLIVQLIVQPDGIADFIAHQKPKEPGRIKRTVSKATRPFRRPQRHAKVQESLAKQLADARGAKSGGTSDFRGGTLTLNGVSVRFGNVKAVQNVSLEVRPGEVVSVIGPNGAGKTTLMDAISGFVKSTGEVTLDGTRISGKAPHRRARTGLVRSFQSLELLEDMTVLDNLRCASDPTDAWSFLIDLVRPNRGKLNAATVAAIDTFDLEAVLLEVPTSLAYGTRHLVAVARAVSAAPRVLMLDEPAAGLSEEERREVGALIRDIATNRNVAILLIEHDVELVRRVSDRVVALDFGEQIATGTPNEVLSNPRVIDAYLGGEADAVAIDATPSDAPNNPSDTTVEARA